MPSGFIFYDGNSYKLRNNIGQKGDKGDKGDQGDIGPTGLYSDGYSSLAVEKGCLGIIGSKLSNISGESFSNTLVGDLLTDLSINASIIDIDCSENIIYFITDLVNTTPIYGIDSFSGDLVFNPTLTESIQWKEIKYARLNGIEIIALTSDLGFAYYDIANLTYNSTAMTGVTSNCSKMYIDSGEISFFTIGRIYRLTSDGTSLSLDYTSPQPITRNSYAFHKAFGCYFNSDTSNPSNLYKTDQSENVFSLDIDYTVEAKTICSDSEYIYTMTPLEDIKKINPINFTLKTSIDLATGIGANVDPYFVYYDGARFIMPNPDSNRIILYYPSENRYDLINPSLSMDISCKHNFYDRLGFILSGGSDLVLYTYKKKSFVNNVYHTGGIYKKPTYITVVDSPYTVTSNDSIICCATSGGSITINLPSDISLFGSEISIIDTDGSASANNITISGVNANNGTPKTISTNFAKATAYCFLTDSGPDAYWVIS